VHGRAFAHPAFSAPSHRSQLERPAEANPWGVVSHIAYCLANTGSGKLRTSSLQTDF